MRYTADCRKYPSEKKCTLSMSADTIEELAEAGWIHAMTAHGHKPEEEESVKQWIRENAEKSE